MAQTDPHGRGSAEPSDILARGWKDVLVRVKREAKDDNLSLLSGGVAFFAMLSLVPALIAVVSIYGLVADPSDVERQAREYTRALPDEARDLVIQQLRNVVNSSSGGLGLAAIGGIFLALWSASSAVKHLITAVNTIYEEDEGRGFVKVRGLSLLLAVGAAVFIVGAILLIAVLPSALGDSSLGTAARWIFNVLRWPLLAVGMIFALAVVYRVGPDRDDPKWRWISWGAVFATIAWIIASVLFSIYTSNFGSYNETYGSLGAVIVLMLWLYLSALLVLLGAELNSEIEHQTARDTTVGPERPMGARRARMADEVGAAR
ncbi:MAG TPA: YihY/virulence factor BrkB family protein [Acidimicrobiia bacterium]|nr:YihY/virulence factor BrkB family protein [Acidimicrobiia bacterium]